MSYLSNFNHQFYGPEDGPRWVFLHGLMGFLSNWRRIIMGIESTQRCLSFDQRGHGKSFQPAHGYAPEDYADDLLKILDELGWDQVTLVGHSMGARNGLNFAYRYPERVRKFILEDITPGDGAEGITYFEKILDAIPTPFPDRAAMRAFFLNDFARKIEARDPVESLSAFLMANMVDLPTGGVGWRFSVNGIIESAQSGQHTNRWYELEGLKVPTLVVKGEKSQYLPLKDYERMLASNPLIRGVIVPGAGHWVHADAPEKFIEILKAEI